MPQVATMSVRFAADIAGFSKDVSKAEKTFLAAGKSMTSMGKELSIGLTAPFLAITGYMTKSAADAEASTARFNRVFGSASDSVNQFAKQMMKVVPVTDDAMHEMLGSTQAFVTQLGLAPRAAIAMTESLTALAADMAAFNHTNIDDAMGTLEKAMAGRTRGLVQLGVVISETDVKQQAYRMGLAAVGGELSTTAKAEATLALVQAKSSMMHGEAARTAGDAAKAMGFLKQATDELADEWGKVLIPFATNVVHHLTDMARTLTSVDDSSKLLILGLGGLAAAVGPVLIGMGAMIRAATSLAGAVRILTGIQGLAALVAGGAILTGVLAGVTLIAATFYQSGAAARSAQSAIDSYKQSLVGLSQVQLGSALIGANSRLLDATGKLNTMTPSKVPGWLRTGLGMGEDPFVAQQRTVSVLMQQHADAKSAYDGGMQSLLFGGGTGASGAGGTSGGTGTSGPSVLDALTKQAQTLLDLQPQLQSGWSGLDALGGKQLSMFDMLTRALAAQSDQYSEVAIKLRELIAQYQQLQVVQLATGTSMLTPLSFMGVTAPTQKQLGVNSLGNTLISPTLAGVPSQDKNIDLKNLPTIPGKLDVLGGIFKDAIASQAQFIAQSLTTVMGVRQANAGGAIGGVIGGALGAGVAKSAIGAGAGAIVGSVVPVVGTVIGSVVGGWIGNTIGGWFSHHKKAADNSATALNSLATAAQKVTETLSAIPQGFDVALARFNAARAGAGYVPSSGGAPTFTGPVTIVANNPQELYDQLTTYQMGRNQMGGSTGLSVALA